MKTCTFLLLMLFASSLFAQTSKPEPVTPKKMEWFEDAKLGIFIHYGIYAVNGIAESWSFKNNQISYEDYMKQLNGFTAKKYDAQQWAELFKEAGARYAVLTSKHHDGVALWDTKLSDLSVVKKTPAARDLITPYAQALRKEGLKVGLYFSHLDWSQPDYATVFNGNDKTHAGRDPFDDPKSGVEDQARWNKFVEFRNGQLKELYDLVNPDLWWFDGDWTRTAEQWKMKELRETMLSWNPNAILNARMAGYGDYATPEQGVPIFGPQGPWELCMTINDSWGYQKKDNNQKSVNYIIRVFADCISMGGNLLLDAGPMEDGTFTPEQVERLKGLGRWTHKHAEAIYGTKRGLPFGHFYGPTTVSKDKKTIYCFVLDSPKDDIVVKGIQNKVTNVRLIGTNETLAFKRNGGAEWNKIPGVLQITVPVNKLDENVTVVAIDLDSPLELYRGSGGAIEQN
ncbi:MAG: alpha-L-fucosidase [Methylococcaceae bacterium]|nr:alpha-L-fucosidase [Prolixibacteraceae bacterium]